MDAAPTPPPARSFRVARTGASRDEPIVLGVCIRCDLLVHNVVDYILDNEHLARSVDEATAAAAAARATRKTGDIRAAMSQLGRAFPPLRRPLPGLDPWDALKFNDWLARGEASDAELSTAAFLLRVWDWHYTWSRPFDAIDALGQWDHANRAVFVEWARDPWWA